MILKKRCNLFIGLFFVSAFMSGQTIKIYKIDDLLKRIFNSSDTIYVVNFWATWCKPCVEELPAFEKLNAESQGQKLKVLLVSMDFLEDISKTVSFLKKNDYRSECVLLNEINGNVFIDKINKRWSGAIPATLFTWKNKNREHFIEKKLDDKVLNETISTFID
jgi:thiol-disulfide isomerase/thioredoxin